VIGRTLILNTAPLLEKPQDVEASNLQRLNEEVEAAARLRIRWDELVVDVPASE
jgi:hypothetical protein